MHLKCIACSPSLLNGALKLNAVYAVGSILEKSVKIDRGTLSFLLASASTSFAPNFSRIDGRLESLAWTYFLQSALVLGLWAGKTRSLPIDKNVKKAGRKLNGKKWIAILIAFLLGTLGSAVGGYFGFQMAKLAPEVMNKSLSKDILRILSACLTASYIGGTVNFFETAKIYGIFGGEKTKNFVNLVAGVDIGVMVLYFWVLKFLRNSSLKRLFPVKNYVVIK